MTQPPPRLYKYFQPERQTFFGDFLVRFTQPAALNDPFEMRPHIAGYTTPEETAVIAGNRWDEHVKEQYDRLVQERGQLCSLDEFRVNIGAASRQRDIDDAIRRLPEHNVEMARHIDEMMNKSIGVLSLCEHPDSLLMWAHYGQEHRGFVVEFDTSAPFFNQKEPPKHVTIEEGEAANFAEEYGRLRKIDYAEERPSLLVTEMKFDAIMTKGMQWCYEDEWRMLMPPDYADKKGLDSQGYPVCLFAVPPSAVTRIIVGANASDDLVQHALQLRGREDAGHIAIERARTDERNFALRFEAIA